MKRTYHLNTIPIVPILSTLGILSICSIIAFSTPSVSAVTEKSDIDVQFTFNDVLSVSLSSPNLVISDLAPGTSADSNIITVTVSSNNPYGYTLNSTVGSTTYANRNLTHSSSASATPFSSINYGTTVADLSSFSPNQWGYSFSTDNGTTWINSNKTDGTTNDTGYSGLPLYTDTENITTLKESSTTSAAAGDNIQFKIAAKADATQLSGEYNNIINFVLTGSPAPVKTMQTVTASDLATLMPNTGDTTTLPDARDDQEYTIAKLADGKYWMTENLNLAGGTALSADDTNVTSEYISSFTTSNNLTKSGDTIVLPASSTSGFDTDNYSYVYNTGNKTSNCASPGCYSYYSWDAATLGSGRSISSDNTDAPYSICPKKWRLPNTRTGTDSSSDFRALIIIFGGSESIETYTSSTTPTGATILSTLIAFPNNFLLTGGYHNGSLVSGGSVGYYWPSTSNNSNNGRLFYFYSGNVYSAIYNGRKDGFSVRCLFSE